MKFARKCTFTGRGMNAGACFNDGDVYIKDELHAIIYAAGLGYGSLDEAYEAGAYYWTEWEIEEGEDYFDEEGNKYAPDGKGLCVCGEVADDRFSPCCSHKCWDKKYS